MARSKSHGTKKIGAGARHAREFTRFINERKARSTFIGRNVTAPGGRISGKSSHRPRGSAAEG
jgi:hypothetical protein